MRPRVPGLPALSPLACAGLAAALLAAPAAAQLPTPVVTPGFADVGGEQLSGLWRPLSTGGYVTYTGALVERYDADGNFVAQLADFAGVSFAGVLAVDPTETFLVVGDADFMGGAIHRVELDGSGATLLSVLENPYDAAFSDAGDLVVSAAPCGFFCGSSLYTVDPVNGGESLLAFFLFGSSGPVAFDAAGNLLYGWTDGQFPAPTGTGRVLLFPAAVLSSPTTLDESDALEFAAGFTALGSLVVQEGTGAVFASDSDFNDGVEYTRIVQVLNSAASSPVLLDASGVAEDSVATVVHVTAPEQGAFLAAYQPEFGGRLAYSFTEFVTFTSFDSVLEPARPQLALSGPGTTGPGPFTLDLTGAVPNGFAVLLYGPTASVAAPEVVAASAPLPLFTALDLGTLDVLPTPLVVGPAGNASRGFVNPGGLEGLVTVQAVSLDGVGTLRGTSNSAAL